VSRRDLRRLEAHDPDAKARLTRHADDLGERIMQTSRGRCVMLGEAGCAIYARRPDACRRFPFRLVATPLGGRVVTEHRCPCRTMGERAVLSAEAARESLLVGGKLEVDARVDGPILLSNQSPGLASLKTANSSYTIAFEDYVDWESARVARLDAGDEIEEVLEAVAFPELAELTWRDVGHLLRSRIDGSACGEALAMAGDVLLMELGELSRRPLRSRPWAWAFDRAEARSVPRDPRTLEADYVADALFSLDWVAHTSLAGARALLATELALLRAVAGRLQALGLRSDRATAEAIAVTELAFASPIGQAAAEAIRV
jgi:Putative zinc- or iron-chelating domain